MSEKEKILQALKKPGSLRFPCNEKPAADIESNFSQLKSVSNNDAVYWYENDNPSVANTRVKVYPTGHMAFYNADGRRFLTTDPQGEPLNECEWTVDPKSGETQLVHARMQLDSRQWIGVKPQIGRASCRERV